jgi:parvulin-like peptidyl-prolyl isomerase
MDADARPEEIAASHILISYAGADRSEVERSKEEALARAEEVLAKVLVEPDSFAELAAEYSDGPTKTKGGDLGTFTFETMAEAFSEAAFALRVGDVSGIVETPFGFHIIIRTR